MKVVRVFGGLGNQMFQYAFYVYLKQKNNDVFLDLSDFKTHKHHTGFALDKVFALDYEVVETDCLRKISVNPNNLIVRIVRKVKCIHIRRFQECDGHHHFVTVECMPISENVYFDGYWQNIKYLEPISESIKGAFEFKKPLTGKNQELAKIIKKNVCVALHVRKGDYLLDSKWSDVCDMDYYIRAMKIIEERVQENIQYVVFSDDMNWVRDNLRLPDEAIYVDWNKEQDSYIDMQLMGLCQHIIMANSTFSWWAAWLHGNEGYIIMPKNWFKNESSERLKINGAITI